MTQLSVRTVQQALMFRYTFCQTEPCRIAAPHPGPVDGLWGARTHDALRAYVATYAASGWGLDAARVLAPLRSVPARATVIDIDPVAADMLASDASGYRAPGRPASPVLPGAPSLPATPLPPGILSPSAPPVLVAPRPSRLPLFIGLGLVLAGGAWLVYRYA